MYQFLLILCFLGLAGTAAAQRVHQAPPYRSDSVFVRGAVKKPLTLTVSNLAGIPVQTGPAHKVTCESGELKKRLGAFKGLLLKDIVEKAGADIGAKKEQGKYILIITATDGYTVTFAYDELMYGQASTSAYLLWEADGRPIAEDGPFIILCTSDIASGPRHVKWVRDIELRKI